MKGSPLTLPPLSLYVHIPWCVRKCPYCDFNSHTADQALPEAAYVAALRADLEREQQWAQSRPLQSVFFGGGTPSLFSARAIGEVLDAAARDIGFAEDVEITLEANPGTAEMARFRDYRAAGVNRLSIGVQSFAERSLAALGRIHSGAEAIRAVEMARKAGFERLNLDLMHGLPGQTEAEAVADLEQAITLDPGHISWYQLTIEPNTEFYRRRPVLPAEPVIDAIGEAGAALLSAKGYAQYEVSAHARPGVASRHNSNYWEFGDYIGIGAGAHGKLTDPGSRRILRTCKIRQPRGYLASADPCAASSAIAAAELPLEFLMNALRLNAGVPAPYFSQRTGLACEVLERPWAQLANRGLLEPLASGRMKATPLGHRFLDTVLACWPAAGA